MIYLAVTILFVAFPAAPAGTADAGSVGPGVSEVRYHASERDVMFFPAQEWPADRQIPDSASVGEFLPLSPLELAVAACESGHRLADGTAVAGTHDWGSENPSPSSSAAGAFQFIDGTWSWVWEGILGEEPPSVRAKHASPAEQVRAFRALWDSGRGAHHWDASYDCWSRM